MDWTKGICMEMWPLIWFNLSVKFTNSGVLRQVSISQAEPTAVLLSLALEFTKCVFKNKPWSLLWLCQMSPGYQILRFSINCWSSISSFQASICLPHFIHHFCLFPRDRVSRCISGSLMWTRLALNARRFTCLCLSSGRIKACVTSLATACYLLPSSYRLRIPPL